MIPLLAKGPLTLLRYGAYVYNEGRPILPAPSNVRITTSVVPASSRNIRKLPEGVEVTSAVDLFSYDEIRGASESRGTAAGRFCYQGSLYEVQHATRRPPFVGQPEHWEATAIVVASLPMPEGPAL